MAYSPFDKSASRARCPKCFRINTCGVLWTRHRANAIVRTRCCKRCGHRFKTTEMFPGPVRQNRQGGSFFSGDSV